MGGIEISLLLLITLAFYIILMPIAFQIDDFETITKFWLAAFILSLAAYITALYLDI